MTRQVGRVVAVLAVLALGAAACGNSEDEAGTEDAPVTDDASTTTGSGGPTTEAAGTEDGRDTFVAIGGVPGVTDDEIAFSVIGTQAGNPLGTCLLDCYLDGIEAYFAFRNSEGGIYGRDLVVGQVLDDELAQNQARALEVISANDTFANFNATLLASGWGDLSAAGVPAYVWGINFRESADRENNFPSIAPACPDCLNRNWVHYANQAVDGGEAVVGAIGYGISPSSQDCANQVGRSIEHYEAEVPNVTLGYVNADLDFGLPNGIGPEVTAMRDAGVNVIVGCTDLNAQLTLAQELERQGINDEVTIVHPNTYNAGYVADNAALFEGDVVTVQFRPFEADAEGTALADHTEWMDETGAEASELAMVGWINATLAFEGLLAAGPEFSRESVVAATNQLTDFDAGGLLVPIDWSRQHTIPTDGNPTTERDCSASVRVVDGAFETLEDPATPFVCWSTESQDWSDPEPNSLLD